MLSIIIVNYKTSDDILKCLYSFVKYESYYINYEFIIVDNNSDDKGLKEIHKIFPFIKIIYAPKNGGFAYGNNLGITNSNYDCILLLNPDTYLEDNSIEKLYNRIQRAPSIDIVGPKLLFPDGTIQSNLAPKTYLTLWHIFCEQFYLNKIFEESKFFNSYMQTYMDYNKEKFVEQVSGAVFMFKRSLIDHIGMLDERYFMYFEETDFCLRAVEKGFKLLYYPESKIFHAGGQSTEAGYSERSNKDFIESYIYYFKKNFGNFKAYIAIVIMLLGSLFRCITLGLVFNKKYIIYFYRIKYITKAAIKI